MIRTHSTDSEGKSRRGGLRRDMNRLRGGRERDKEYGVSFGFGGGLASRHKR